MHPIALVILDGLGDRTHAELGGLTPLEAAHTPNLDALVAAGSAGMLWPLGPGRAPSSPLAHAVLFGYAEAEWPGRGLLEAYGEGVEPAPDEVVARASFLRTEVRDGVLWVAERPDPRPDLDTRASHNDDIDLDETIDGVRVTFRHTGGAQGILTLRAEDGRLSHEVTDGDPLRHGVPLPAVVPFAEARDPEAAERTARVLNEWTRRSRARLAGRELDTAVTKWPGTARPLTPFTERTGLRGVTVAGGPLYGGLARALGLGHREDGGDRDRAFSERIGAGLGLLERGEADFVHIHTKATDQAGHKKSPSRKVEIVEMLDAAFAPHLERMLRGDLVVAVTGDHATPCKGAMYHSGEAVPFLLVGGTGSRDEVVSFAERTCRRGALGFLHGRDVMPVMLNAADRSAFLAERYTRAACLGVAAAGGVEHLRP